MSIVQICTYKGYLVLTGPTEAQEDWIPAGEGLIGCILQNCAKNLAISKPALQVLQRVRRSRDDIGDLMSWNAEALGWCFGWLGGPTSIKSIARIEQGDLSGDWDFRVPGAEHYTIIRNNVPKETKATINNLSAE